MYKQINIKSGISVYKDKLTGIEYVIKIVPIEEEHKDDKSIKYNEAIT